MFSEERQEERAWDVAEIADLQPAGHWSDYFAGVAQGLVRAGVEIAPRPILYPQRGAGGFGLEQFRGTRGRIRSGAYSMAAPSIALKLAQLCQRAEIDFVGNPCGIMDQYVSVFGEEHKALKLDCRSLTHEAVSIPDGVDIYAVNTMVKHELSGSAYRDRVDECATAAEMHFARLSGGRRRCATPPPRNWARSRCRR